MSMDRRADMESTKLRYQHTQDKVLRISKEIRHMDFDWFLDQLAAAENIAPMIDPTMYRAASKNLELIKKMANLLLVVQDDLPEIPELIQGLEQAKEYNDTHPLNRHN